VTITPARVPRRAAGRFTGRPHAAVVIEFPPRRVDPAVVTLRAVAPAARPCTLVVDGYVRPSAPNHWCASPASIDRRHIAYWAAARGWRIGRMFEEDAPRGPAGPRTQLCEALERVESRESDGLVVARLKDLGRSLHDAAAALERISAAGGSFVSVYDGVDLGTPTGRRILTLLLGALDW
jgi:hypothetical protein